MPLLLYASRTLLVIKLTFCQAEHALTGGDNYCTLYEAWADRGMGPDAKLRGALPWG